MQVTKCCQNIYNIKNFGTVSRPNNAAKKSDYPKQGTNYQNNVFLPNYLSYNMNFKALNWGEINAYTKELSKRIYSKRHIKEFDEIYKNADGITAGNGIPEIWTSRIKDIASFDKDDFIEKFGEIFFEERKFSDFGELRKNLTYLFRKHKIIDDETSLNVQYIGKGFQAWVYKICIGDEQDKGVVTKLFKRHISTLQNHGNKTEQNLAEYVRTHTNNDSEFVKYHYGDTKNGIMLVDYIPQNIEHQKNKFDLSDIGIGYGDDFPKNRINGHICDYGGIETVSNLIGNITAQEVHRAIKYAKTDEEKIKIFNEIFDNYDNSKNHKNKVVGLVHGIKFMPEEMQTELYKKCYELKSHRVNIALIQNFKNFPQNEITDEIIDDLVLKSTDQKELETIAKEIKYVPEKPRHIFFEQQKNSEVSAVVKYLARNLNQYYKNLPNRRNIYETFITNCDTYSGLALITAMKYISSSYYDKYFEEFYKKDNPALNTALSRSLEIFKDNPNLQKKWINKLLEYPDINVTRGLAESVSFVEEENRFPLFEQLLNSKDKVTKEFLAENLITVPGYNSHTVWVKQLLNGADNIVRLTLLNTIKSTSHQNSVKEKWIEMILDGVDVSIKEMVNF